MSRPDYVSEEPVMLASGLADLLADPAHYRRSEMQVIDYGEAVPDLGPEPLGSLAGPKPEPASRWRRLSAALRGGRKPRARPRCRAASILTACSTSRASAGTRAATSS